MVRYLMLDLLKIFFIVDHPKKGHCEQESKRLIIGWILGLLEMTIEASYNLCTTKYNSISLDFLKTFSEIIVASKCDPIARIEKQAVS